MMSATARSFSARSLPDIFGHGPSSNALRAACDGALRVFAAGLGDIGDLLAGRGCEGREGLPRLRVDPGTVDEQLRVAHRDSFSQTCRDALPG